MKKAFFVAALAMAAATPAFAENDGFYFKPYVGLDYQNTYINYKGDYDHFYETDLNGGNIHVGARVHKYLGFEGGYSDTLQARKDVNDSSLQYNTKSQMKQWTLDAMGYLPVDAAQKVELIATAGVAVSKFTAQLNFAGAPVTGSDTSNVFRVGGGAQYWLTKNVNARVLVRYQTSSHDSGIDDAIVTTAGLNLSF